MKRFLVLFFLLAFALAYGKQVRLTMESAAAVAAVDGIIHGGNFIDGAAELALVGGGNRAFAFGGMKDGIELTPFTLPNTGCIQFYCKRTEKMLPEQPMVFMDSTGTPPFHNCITVVATVDASGEGKLRASFVNAKDVPNPLTALETQIVMHADEWHHVALCWHNINSGETDASGELYWDGRLAASFAEKKIDIPNPAKRVFIGSVDHQARSNKCGEGAFAMDEVVIQDEPIDAAAVAALAARLRLRPIMADGKPLPNMPVLGGGEKQYRSYAFPDFPIENGAIFVRTKLDKIIPKKSLLLFDICGTPPWHDRIAMMLKMREGGKVELYGVFCGTPTGMYISRVVSKVVDWDVNVPHTIALQWKNISSGRTNAEGTLWLDGINVATLAGFECNITNPGKVFRLGGGQPPSGTWAEKDMLSIEECRVWRDGIPAQELEQLCQTQQEEKLDEVVVGIPKANKAPAIDGKIEDEIWTYSATLGYLHDYRYDGLAVPYTTVKACYDDKFIYVMWKAFFEEAKPFGVSQSARDAALWNEDSVELFFEAGTGKVQVIISAHGDIYDAWEQNTQWNSTANYAVSRGNQEWYGEIAIPRSELQLDAISSLKATACRNMGALQCKSSCWIARNYTGTGTWMLTENPVVLTDVKFPVTPTQGTNQGAITLRHTVPATTNVEILFSLGQGEGKSTVRVRRELMPSALMETSFDFQAIEEGINEYHLMVRDAEKNILINQKGFLTVKPPLYVTTEAFFYKGIMYVNVDASKLEVAKNTGTVELFKDNAAIGKPVEFTLKDGMAKVEVPTLALKEAGSYNAVVTVQSAAGKEIQQVCQFNFAPRPTVINPNAGRKTYFYDGWFTPKFENGVVKCWNRVYTWKNTIFPSSIISAGADLLADTPYFEYRLNGKVHRLSSAAVTPVGQDEEKTVFKVVAEDDALAVSAKVRVEFDGFIGYDLDLAPRDNAKIDRLTLVIPMDAKYAIYKLEGLETTFSLKRNHIPNYPAAGKNFPFVNKAGVGTYERALFVFNESDEGWLPYDRKNVESIIPGEKVVEWRWNIVDGEVLGKLPTMRCGFQVTPYKKLRDKYLTGHRQIMIWPGGVLRPGDTPYLMKNIEQAKAFGATVLQLHMNWSKHTGGIVPDDPELLKEYVKAAHKAGLKVVLYRCSITNENEPSFLYFGDLWVGKPVSSWFGYPFEPIEKRSSIGRCPNSPEYIDWYVGGSEMLMREYGIDGFYYDFGVGSCNNPLHGCGYVGENTQMREGESTLTIGINVGKLTQQDKARRPTVPVLAQRELWKRMYNMVHELKGEEGIIDAHTGNPARVFSYPFVDTMYHSESAACHGSQQLESLDMYRFYYSKEYMGSPGSIILYAADKDAAFVRNNLALTLPHREIYRPQTNKWQHVPRDTMTLIIGKLWKLLNDYDVDTAEWMPYYTNKDVVKILDGTEFTVASAWYHEDKALMVVSNLTDDDRTITLELSGKMAKFTKATNAENPASASFAVSENRLSVVVGKRDFILLHLQL